MIRRLPLALLALAALPACDGAQSAFSPRGEEAERVHLLFWIMTIGGTAIFVLVLLLTAVAILSRGRLRDWISGERFIFGLGLVFPLVTLSALLGYGLALMGVKPLSATILPEEPRLAVVGERWWWRVFYTDADGNRIETANEVHLPTNEPVSIALTSTNVIHSFWIPSLAGKLDMIPGRTNVQTLVATEEAILRGQCAEYCGGPHALMAFPVVTHSPEDFEAWLAAEAAPAQEPETEEQRLGQQLFLQAGCGACHAIRGTEARGAIGPDLTHVGSRLTLAAGTLPNTVEDFARWIAENQHIKPENLMPPYLILDEEELLLIGAYLDGLD